jgi:CRISPR-associated protein Csd1
MLLEQAAAYADTQPAIAPQGYQDKPIRYIIDLDATGARTHITDVRPGPKDRGLTIAVPHAKRSSGIRPILFADYATYTLGIPREKDDPARGAQLLESYRDLVDALMKQSSRPEIAAVSTFLHRLPDGLPELPDDFDPSANITFEVNGVRLVNLPEVRSFWANELGLNAEEGANSPTLQCIVCGRMKPAVRVHPLKIKGIISGQSGGTDLISANSDAYFSYGLENSLIAPTCATCAEKYANGLNALLANGKTHTRVSGVEYICWVASGIDTVVIDCFDEPDSEEAVRVINAVYSGDVNTLRDFEDQHFFATSLSGNGARTVVLSWLTSTLADAYRSLAEYFRAHAIAAPDGGEPMRYSIRRLASAMVRDPQKQQAPRGDVAAMMRFALAGTPLPLDLLNQAVLRCRAEQGVRRDRAALIKMVFSSRSETFNEGGRMEQLNPDERTPAYLCGRLLAVLDSVQRQALGNPNTTIIDRFYGSASATPASVFGTLMRGAQPHLAKLRKDRPGAYRALNERLENIAIALKTFPKTLTLQDQGLFALGFYHQRAEDRRQARERAEAKNTGEAEAAAETE